MPIFAPCGEDSEVEDGKDGDDVEDLGMMGVQDVEVELGAVLDDLDHLPSVLDLAAFVEEGVHVVVAHDHMVEEDTRNSLEVEVDMVDTARGEGGRVIVDHDEEVGVLLVHVPFEVASFGGEHLGP